MYFSIQSQSRGFLAIALSMITCLLLLINLSFKIVVFSGVMFTVSSLLCPFITCFYLVALRQCSLTEQRHILNLSLIALYLFSIGVYFLVHLPEAEYMHHNPVYQIVFENIPKKFFATTLAFGLSFYLPHWFCCRRLRGVFASPKQSVMLALLGGLGFFAIDFYLLFSGLSIHSFHGIMIDSFLICSILLLIMSVSYLAWIVSRGVGLRQVNSSSQPFPLYHYLVAVAVIILLICLACEYHLVSLYPHWVLAANGMLFPIALIAATVVSELYGYRAGLVFTFVMVIVQLFFDALLMLAVALPSPDFYDLNPFYDTILPKRIPAATAALLAIFLSNATLLDRLKRVSWCQSSVMRIIIANVCATTLLCMVSYSMLFNGIYSYDQILHLALHAWIFKILFGLSTLPLLFWIYSSFCKYLQASKSMSSSVLIPKPIHDVLSAT